MNSKVDYLNNPWRPVPQSVLKDVEISRSINEEGYSVQSWLDADQITRLKDLFGELHDIDQKDGGMFYSVYSQNLDYRKRIHDEIGNILAPTLASHFKDHRILLNSFVVKASGEKSEFYLHQDTSGLDEWNYSPLNLWIPLDDVNEEDGCLGIVPCSHKFFSPYRSISFPAPFDDVSDEVRRFIRPVRMKQGEVFVFDNRLVHNSFVNRSGKTRVAVVCGLFPKNAKLTTCFKPTYRLGGKVELIEHEDDFLLKHPNFLIDCQSRPNSGKSIGWVDDDYQAIERAEFRKLCAQHGVEPMTEAAEPMGKCNLISEPI